MTEETIFLSVQMALDRFLAKGCEVLGVFRGLLVRVTVTLSWEIRDIRIQESHEHQAASHEQKVSLGLSINVLAYKQLRNYSLTKYKLYMASYTKFV